MNGNGVQDAGETGLQGWTFELLDAAGNVVGTTVSGPADAAGRVGTFCFSNVPAGGYTVREVAQPGWVQTVPSAPGTYSLTVGAGSAPRTLLFGNMLSPGSSTSVGSTICGTKFEDKNGNGRQDEGEAGLGGWTIQLTDERGNVLATVVTRKDGTYCFTGLPSGTYTLAEVMQPGWEQTFPGSPGTQTITVDGSHGKEGVNFGNRKPPGAGSVCGTKFEDKNGNGKQDKGEPGLGGWTIQITDEKGNVVGTVVTNKDGTFCFKDLHLGLFTLSEVMQPGWQQTLPGGTGTYSVQLTAEQSESKPLLFGNVQTAGTVCGIKYEDKNGNGKQDPGELGLDGWTIQAVNAAGQLVATVVTRKDGTYCFTGLRPGVYTFGEVMQPGWQQTFPGSPGTQTVTVLGGQNPQSIDFGNQKKPDTCCLSFTFQQGRTDNFATANGAEPAQPSAALIQALPASASYTSFDGTASDKFLAHTFTLPAGNCVESATLEFKAKPLEGMSDNDTVSLRFAGAPGTPTWGSYLGAGNSSPGLLSNAWTLLNYSTGQVFSLDLGSLPGGISLIPTLNAQRFLDFVVQDDTSVDYVRLTVKFCECAGSGATGPKSASDALALQPSVRAGVSVRLALDSTDAKVNGEAVRLSTPAVLRNGSTMVPLRWIGDALGAEVQWDQTERRATYLLGDLKVELWVDKVTARVNGKDATLSSAPTLIDGSTFVPLRFLGEAFGLTVKFNPDDQSINIFDQQP